MKRIFTLLFLTFIVTTGAFSQKSYVNYDKDSRWFFGINGGATWHTRTETDNVIKGGYGFTFGHSFGMRPEKLFSWDLRLRYLHGWWSGQATSQYTLDSTGVSTIPSGYGNSLQTYQDSTGYFVPNFRSQLMSGSLELALNTNRLRENTGWNFQIFGGIGIKGYDTKVDLVDSNNEIYDYDNIGGLTKPNLLSNQDGNYETYVTGSDSEFEVDWAASFGAGISYQVTPWMSMGISHKMTWLRNDNLFDPVISPVGTNKPNDIYHYSSAGLKFHLFGGNHSTKPDDIIEDVTDPNVFDNPNNNITTPVDNTPKQKPIVDIYDPGSSPYTTTSNTFKLLANVHHVDGKQNVTFKQDGNINNNFYYNPATDKFSSNVVLHPGQNIFEITGVNGAGQDYESTIIIYEKEVPQIQPPIVTITNPPNSPHTTSSSTFNFASTVLNVDSKNQIKVYFNGAYMSNFTYSTTSKNLYATLNLQEGTNTITVTATNPAGSDSKTATLIYRKPQVQQPPVVDFITPPVDPFVTSQAAMNITASVLNVTSKNNITVKINGNQTSNFSYNANTKQVNFNVNLNVGANVLEVKGVNNVGQDYETTTIIYKKPEVPKPPIVTFIDPALDPTTVYVSSYNVKAKVLYVDGASDITLKINGIQSYNFSYSTSSKIMNFTTNLNSGANVIEITGTNNAGQDTENTTIVYRRVVPQAPPVVNITYPVSDNQVFNSSNLTLVSSVLNVSSASNIAVLVNGQPTYNFNYNTATKILNLPLTLNEGSNTVKITGTNTAGSDNDTRIIIYKKPVVPAPPTVTYVNPPTSPFLVTQEAFTMTANTTNISSKSQISLLFNGNLVPDQLYTLTSSNQIIYNSTLIEGNNIFEIIVTNNDGSDDAMAIVTYKKAEVPCIIPTVGYIHPVPYSTVNDPNVLIDAQINNYTPGTTIQLVLNGVGQGLMSYNTGTSIAAKAAVLVEGSNAVTVIVTNDCGTNQATFTLNYVAPEAPCVDPMLTPTSMANTTTQSETASVVSGVSEITAASQITVTVNGQNTPFTFDAGTNSISVNDAALSLGNNSIVVTATNDCGSATLTYHIVRKSCDTPIISGSSPAHNSVIETSTMNFSASVQNATQSEIQFIVNGISQAFTFNQQSGLLSAAVDLAVGDNAISIIATNSCGSTRKDFEFVHTLPCESIVVGFVHPTSATATVTESNYSIALHATGTLNSSGVTASLNGTSVAAAYNSITGEVDINNLTLVDGVNTVVVNLTNDCSSETVTYSITYNGCQPPEIEIPGINSGTVVNTSTIDFHAVVQNSNGAGNIQLLLNGQAQSFDFNDQTMLLTSTLVLNEGSNSIILTVNGCETANENINVTYEVPCEPISYSLMQPASNNTTVVSSSFSLSMNLMHVENNQQISATLNGTAVTFTYSAGTNSLSVSDLTLIDGANTIVVTATNDCSSETITYTVQYDGCQEPVITLGSNANSMTTSAYTFNASVTNISSPAGVGVTLNGAAVPFIFNAQNGNISGEVTLAEGANTIVISANGCASDSKTINVAYAIPCDPMVISLSAPSQLETSVADELFAFNLVAQNANTISVKLNGAVIPHTYSNGVINANLTLIDGDNTVIATMANDCSNETKTFTIHHDGCDAPVITTSMNSASSSTATYTFTALISNVDNANQLGLDLNGANVTFTFDPITTELVATMTLTEGQNVITLNANGCASASANINVSYALPCSPVSYSLGTPSTLSQVVNGNTVDINLTVQSADEVSATINGAAVNANYANNIVSINNVPLNEGANTLVVSFSNVCSSETVTYTIESDQCPNSPLITVFNNNVVTTDELYNFTCQILHVDNANDVSVKLNGTVIPSTYVPGTNTLSAPLNLVMGANEVAVTAVGCETTSVVYTVTRESACDPITFTHMIPQTNDTMHVNAPNLFVKINAQNVTQSGVTATLNGAAVNFSFLSGSITVMNKSLVVGSNTLVITMTNECSTSSANFHIEYGVDEPDCDPPVIGFVIPDPVVNDPAYTLNINVSNADSSEIELKHNGQVTAFTYSNGVVSAPMTLIEGANNFVIEVDGCEHVVGTSAVTYTLPCTDLTFTYVAPANSVATLTESAYAIELASTNITNAAQVTATLNGTTVPAVLNTQDGKISISNLTLIEGANSVIVNMANDCSNQMLEYVITYNPPVAAPLPCGPRFNPGNSEWQFCLVTPNGTYNRDDLSSNSNFTYSGPATAAYFKPIAGGGDAIVNGSPYPVSNGNYYLFEGNLTVDVSSSHPGSMGHWEICINSNANPTFGNGNNRPASPCETSNGNGNGNGNGHGQTYLQPEFINVNPSSLSVNVSKKSFTFQTKLKNVNEKADLKMYLNGGNIDFNFNMTSKVMNKVITLREGVNEIKVDATNGDKSKSITYRITYAAPIVTPVITNVNPAGTKAESKMTTYTFKAKVENVSSKTGVKISVNGIPLKSFTYSSSTKMVTAVVRLKTGNNTIKLEAVNGTQKADRIYNISYGKTGTTINTNGNTNGDSNDNTGAKKPVITNMSPSGTSINVSKASYMFKAKLSNVTSKSGVQVLVNGRAFTGFTYSSSTGQLTAVVSLRSGLNTVKVIAKNGKLAAERTYSITYKANTRPNPNNGGVINNGGTKPTNNGTVKPTNNGKDKPTNSGTVKPTNTGTVKPTNTGTVKPTNTGTVKPTNTGTVKPTNTGTVKPTNTGTVKPTNTGTTKPTNTGVEKGNSRRGGGL